MTRGDLAKLALLFVTWRLVLIIIIAVAIRFIPLQLNFLGGGYELYQNAPFLWSWANFDGEHYLSIASAGYRPLSHFFFPLYPLLIRSTTFLSSHSQLNFLIAGLVLSHITFFIGIIGLFLLLIKDYSKSIAYMTIVLILSFPTSFYFASLYTESLFFMLIIWSFLFARRSMLFPASVLGGLATATRVVGIALLPALLIEWWFSKKEMPKTKLRSLISLSLVPLGLLAYMVYLKLTTGDPFIFFNQVGIFGEQRSSAIILLPQVFYRYLFKIIPNLPLYWPVVFTTFLELISAIIFLMAIIWGFWRLRASYWVFLLCAYLVPTFSGSFSSMPRYVLILFPGFLLFSQALLKLPKAIQFTTLALLWSSLVVALALFSRGYWVS